LWIVALRGVVAPQTCELKGPSQVSAYEGSFKNHPSMGLR